MPVKMVILAGGLGTRLSEETVGRPKPMVEIGGQPILWHIMALSAAQGIKEFVVALGYRSDVVKRYFLEYRQLHGSVTIDLPAGKITSHDNDVPDWKIHLVETGMETQTGGRLRRVKGWVKDGTFMATYGDGLIDVDLQAVLAFHRKHGKLATVTAVRPPSRFGGLDFDGDQVINFSEKPQTGEGWINGGFFVLEPRALDYVDSDETPWERAPIERLTADGQLMAFRHPGFFQPMDTLRDRQLLEELWHSGKAPWKKW